MAAANVTLVERVREWFGSGDAGQKRSRKKRGSARSKGLSIDGGKSAKDQKGSEPKRKGPWPPERLQVLQQLWGPEFLTVGGEEAIKELIHPFGLSSDMSVAEIGCGIGGGSRLIANETGAWVTGYEQSAILAKIGMEASITKGMKRKAIIEFADFTEIKSRPHSKDAVLSKEALFTVSDKDAAYETIAGLIRPGGQLMYTDLMATGPELDNPAVAQWQTREPRRPHLWQLSQVREKLESLGLEVRVAEDITQKYRTRALAGFNQMVEQVDSFRTDTSKLKWVILEAEIWFHRIAALDSGQVNVSRIYAMLPLKAAFN